MKLASEPRATVHVRLECQRAQLCDGSSASIGGCCGFSTSMRAGGLTAGGLLLLSSRPVSGCLRFAGGIAAVYVLHAGDSFPLIALSVAITLALGALGQSWFARRPWWRLLAGRVAAYSEGGDPRDYAWALIAVEQFGPAMHALRGAGLNAMARSAIAPPDAPHFDTTLHVYRPTICARPGQESVSNATRRVLRQAGIEARVDGLLADGEPIPGIAPVPSPILGQVPADSPG